MDAEPRETETEEADIAADLVRRIHLGEPAAENELAQRYGERLRYVLNRQLAAYPHDVDDIIQESLTATILKLRDSVIDDPARLGGFIYGIARNLRLSKLREHAKHDGLSDPELIPKIPDGRKSPEEVLSSAETTRVVRRLLAELGTRRGRERDREVLLRLFLHQEKREDICEALQLSPEHLRRVVHRAKQRLKALMVESLEQDDLEEVPYE